MKIRFKVERLITLKQIKSEGKVAELQPGDRFQQEMFSSLDEQVSEDSIVRIIDKVVDKLYEMKDEGKINQTPEVGRPEYPKRLLLKLYLYGYMNRIKSSRNLEKECKRNIEVMWLLGRLSPDHWTISNFRKENHQEIKELIKLFNKFLLDTGYLEGKIIVIDGTKLKANAPSSGNKYYIDELKEMVQQTDEKITYYLEAFNRTDEYEEQLEELRKEKEELEKLVEQLKKQNKEVYVKTDPDSNIMKTKNGKIVGYNVQLSCDKKNKLIVATDVNDRTNDFRELRPMYEKSKEMLEKKPEEILADAGYYSADEIEYIEKEEKVITYVAELPEKGNGEFKYDKQRDEYICSQGKKLKFETQKYDVRGRKTRTYRCHECRGCPIRSQCTKSARGRMKIRYVNQDFRDEYRNKMMKKKSKEKMRLRKTIIEHPIGTIKLWLGRNPLLLRGKEKVKTEINMVSFSYNILRIFNIDGYERLNNKINKYQWKLV